MPRPRPLAGRRRATRLGSAGDWREAEPACHPPDTILAGPAGSAAPRGPQTCTGSSAGSLTEDPTLQSTQHARRAPGADSGHPDRWPPGPLFRGRPGRQRVADPAGGPGRRGPRRPGRRGPRGPPVRRAGGRAEPQPGGAGGVDGRRGVRPGRGPAACRGGPHRQPADPRRRPPGRAADGRARRWRACCSLPTRRPPHCSPPGGDPRSVPVRAAAPVRVRGAGGVRSAPRSPAPPRC